LDANDVSGFAYEISGQGKEASVVAREWMKKNSSRVDSWLGL